MRYLSVCSGIEAATQAWHRLGWEPAGLSEIEAFPRAVLEQRLGAVAVDFDDHTYSPQSNVLPLFGDFTKIEAHHVGPIDLLVGGTPCQSFSIAGKRLGLDDPRGNLAIEFLALARRLRPRWLVWENVPGVRSSWSGDAPGAAGNEAGWHEWTESCDFAAFLDLFRECGYRGGWRTLDAQYVRVDGFERAVPQRRERVFVVGYLGDFARAGTVLFERESLSVHPAPRREKGKNVAGTIGASLERCSADEAERGTLIAATLDANFGRLQGCSGQDLNHGHSHLVAHTLSAEGFDSSEDGSGRGTPIVPIIVPFDTTQITSATNASKPKAGDPCHPLARSAHPPAIAFSAKDHGADASEDVSPTLRAGGHTESHANAGVMPAIAFDARQSDVLLYDEKTGPLDTDGHTYGVTDGWAVRRLTPRECERLQGFPDDFTLITWRGKPAPDGPRYKAIGNSMAVNVMRWLGERIDYVERACAAAAGSEAA